MKEIRVEQIPDFVHKKLKMAAVNYGMVLSDMAVKIFTDHVDEYTTVVEDTPPLRRRKKVE